ncbi:sulfur globule protein precursor [Flaviflagellibacter deserti]|uniref:Sulfur globule protein n=1 Tax=Flaviflagellibacter deserti TaxID=2267266 RepID=A0ABV9Z5I3_9HYPH
MTIMLRKIVLGFAAAAALGASALVPTAASAGGVSIGFGGFGVGFHGHHSHHGHHGYYSPGVVVIGGPTCYWKKVKVYNPGPGPDWYWTKKKICY